MLKIAPVRTGGGSSGRFSPSHMQQCMRGCAALRPPSRLPDAYDDRGILQVREIRMGHGGFMAHPMNIEAQQGGGLGASWLGPS